MEADQTEKMRMFKKRKLNPLINTPKKRNINTLCDILVPPQKRRKLDHVTTSGIIIYLVL